MIANLKYKIVAAVSMAAIIIASALYAAENNPLKNNQVRADIIKIDSMKAFGELERPAVVFQHDRHTKALEQRGEDCSTCHINYENEPVTNVFLFGRFGIQDKETTLEIYHDGCIGCHEADRTANRESGPIECGECHVREPGISSNQQLPDFNKSLHQRHITATDNDCSTCHHGYELDAPVKILSYNKGKETSCRDCHLSEDFENRKSYTYVAHRLCVNCHLTPSSQNIASKYQPPSTACAECHDPDHLSKIKVLDPVPRLDRGQPDITFLKTIDADSRDLMNMVVFDHQRHEIASDDCRTCHHKTMDRCESCHSLAGSEKGEEITLSQAMHKEDSAQSCIGCHTVQKEAADCAGCHNLIHKENIESDYRKCQHCHIVPVEAMQKAVASGKKPAAADYKSDELPSSVDFDALPEVVEINAISQEYHPVDFPHRSIVEALMGRIQDNDLAAYFHQGQNAVCSSCHHHTEEFDPTPPGCVSCHSPTGGTSPDGVPDAKSAYHQQCFECHQVMNITHPASTDCEACHAQK